MVLQKTFLTFLVVSILTLPAFGQTTTPTSRTSTFVFAPVGLGSTETLQINLTNTASDPATGSAASCKAIVTFLNTSGSAIGVGNSINVTAGQTSSLTLTSAEAGTGIHGEVRVEIVLTLTSGVPCTPLYTLETYDTSSGATHLYEITSGPTQGIGGGVTGR